MYLFVLQSSWLLIEFSFYVGYLIHLQSFWLKNLPTLFWKRKWFCIFIDQIHDFRTKNMEQVITNIFFLLILTFQPQATVIRAVTNIFRFVQKLWLSASPWIPFAPINSDDYQFTFSEQIKPLPTFWMFTNRKDLLILL